MKIMRGFVDPITLGFILTALVAGAGATAHHTAKERVAKVQTAAEQVQKVSPAPAVAPAK